MYIIKIWVILESLVPSFTQDHKADLLTLLKKLKKEGCYIYLIKEFIPQYALNATSQIF